MSTALTDRENRKSEREARLTQLAEVAKQAHEGVVKAAREAVVRALEAGRALLEARDLCRKGTWTAWLSSHFGRSTSSAHDYMRIAVFVAENGNDPGCVAGLSYREVMRMLSGRVGTDGRANARRMTATAEPAPAVALASPDKPTDPLAPAMKHLEQTLDALRDVVQANVGDVDYAVHVLLLLERIHIGMPTRTWFWD